MYASKIVFQVFAQIVFDVRKLLKKYFSQLLLQNVKPSNKLLFPS